MTKQTSKSPNLTYFWHKKALLSFIAAIFIVAIHNSATGQYTGSPDLFTNLTWFYRNITAYTLGAVAVPLFFFISGITMFRNYQPKMYFQKLRSRAKTLLTPYLIWNTIGLMVAILCFITPLSSLISGRESFSFSFENIFQGIFLYKYNFQFWFLYDLIIYVLLTPIIYLLVSHKTIGFFTCLITLALPMFFDHFLGVDLHFTTFYFIGCFIGKHYLSLFAQPITKNLTFISGFTFIIILVLKMLNIYGLIELPTIISQILLLGSLLSLWFASDPLVTKLKPHKFTTEFFPLYTLHTYFIAIIVKLFYFLGSANSFVLLFNEIFSTIVTVIVVTAIAYSWHQKLPKSYKIMFGH